jgi:flagellar export protein FliJ
MLVRLHELQLEQARIERAALDAAVEHQRVKVEALQREVASAQALAESLVTSASGVAPDALRHMRNYVGWQNTLLAEQQLVLQRSSALAEQARANVRRRFERLSAMERACDRQARAAARERVRSQQRALDEQGSLRAVRRRADGTYAAEHTLTHEERRRWQ